MATEKRLIDANVAIERAKNSDKIVRSSIWETGEVVEFLEDCPIVDAVEVVHGNWSQKDIISKKAGYGVRYYYHAECDVAPCRLFECAHDYCPNCGAKMDGDGNDS